MYWPVFLEKAAWQSDWKGVSLLASALRREERVRNEMGLVSREGRGEEPASVYVYRILFPQSDGRTDNCRGCNGMATFWNQSLHMIMQKNKNKTNQTNKKERKILPSEGPSSWGVFNDICLDSVVLWELTEWEGRIRSPLYLDTWWLLAVDSCHLWGNREYHERGPECFAAFRTSSSVPPYNQ